MTSDASSSTSESFDLPIIDLTAAQPLKITSLRPVGHYAYAISFSDGHNTGIYTLEHLRRLGPAYSE